MAYAKLIDVWPTGGQAAVIFSSLQDAGFEPIVDGDIRGWMYYRGWPLGAYAPASLWVPEARLDDARRFLQTPAVPTWPAVDGQTFWYRIAEHRRLCYGIWFIVLMTGLVAL